MTAIAASSNNDQPTEPDYRGQRVGKPDTLSRRAFRSAHIVLGGGVLLLIMLLCFGSLPWTLNPDGAFYYDQQNFMLSEEPPAISPNMWFGSDQLGRSILSRCLLGGTISLFVGLAAALISIVLGCTVGLLAGYRGGMLDSVLMRTVDVIYGLPYLLLVILLKIALEGPLETFFSRISPSSGVKIANLVVLFCSIGLVSWLTMARVVRGQVLSLRNQPFIEAARAGGVTEMRIFFRHLLPNLLGPIIVYATLTIPVAILQESFLSFLGIGVKLPLPSWGNLAADGLKPALDPLYPLWWQLLFPCILLALTLLSLNFLGDGLRDLFDPKREAAKL